MERTDNWLASGNPWEIPKPEVNYQVGWGGRTERHTDDAGQRRVRWTPERVIKGVYY